MADEKVTGFEPGEEMIITMRPSWRSFWVFILGLLLCGVGPFVVEHSPLSPQAGLVFAAVFALLILRRWSDVYTITNRRVMVRGGLFMRETYAIRLTDVVGVESFQGINLKLVGAGHVLVRSGVPHQENIMMYGQANPEDLKNSILRLAQEAGRQA